MDETFVDLDGTFVVYYFCGTVLISPVFACISGLGWNFRWILLLGDSIDTASIGGFGWNFRWILLLWDSTDTASSHVLRWTWNFRWIPLLWDSIDTASFRLYIWT